MSVVGGYLPGVALLSDYEMSCGPVDYIPLFKASLGCFQELFVSLDGESPARVAT